MKKKSRQKRKDRKYMTASGTNSPSLLSLTLSLCTIFNYLSQEWQTSKQHLNSQLGEIEKDMKSRTNSEEFNSAWIEERSPQVYGDITRDGQKQNISTTIKPCSL